MLPQQSRMRRSEEFQYTIRRGVRAGRSTLVVHAVTSQDLQTRVGFVVSRAVGNAVTRNRVKRRLRHLVAEKLTTTPAATSFVVRALPTAATAATELSTDLTDAWQQSVQRLQPKGWPARGAPAESHQAGSSTP